MSTLRWLFFISLWIGYGSQLPEEWAVVQAAPIGCHPPVTLVLAGIGCLEPTYFLAACAVFVLSSVTLLMTRWTRVSAAVCFLSFALYRLVFFSRYAYVGTDYVPHSDNIVAVLLFSMILIGNTKPELDDRIFKLCLSLTFFASAVAKLRESGLAWADGQALQYYLFQSAWLFDKPWLEAFAQNLSLCSAASCIVLSLELLFPVSLLKTKLELPFAIAGLVFHLLSYFFLEANFFVGFAAVYWAYFVPYMRRSREKIATL